MYSMAQGNMTDSGVLLEHRDLLLDAISAGVDRKNTIYSPGAAQCLTFYEGDHRYLINKKAFVDQQFLSIGGVMNDDDKPRRVPNFIISDNWAAKFVQIIAPYLSQGEMVRTVQAVKPYVPIPAAFGVDDEQTQMMKYQMLGEQYKQQQMMAMQQYQMVLMQLVTEKQVRETGSDMMQRMLQYTQKELGLTKERRAVIEEALVLGFGGFLTEMYKMPGTQQSDPMGNPMPGSEQKLISSRYVLADDIVWDPDSMNERDAKWLAIQCRMPAWQFARLYGVNEYEIKPDAVSKTNEKAHRRLILGSGGYMNENDAPPGDEVVYWKFFSRVGMGARLQQITKRSPEMQMLDEFLGDFCFFIVTKAVDYCANLSPMLLQQAAQQGNMQAQQAAMRGMRVDPRQVARQAIKASCQWPTPYYLDLDDPWPLTTLGFHRRNGSPYQIPHLQFSLSYLKFLVWAISFVADKCYRSQRDIWVIDKTCAESLRKAIEDGDDEAIVELQGVDEKTINQFVQILSAPEIKQSLMDVYRFFEQKIEQMTGLSDLMQASMARGMRTATEAQVVSDASQLRPRDMLARVHQTDSRVARKEAQASIFHYGPQDVMPVLGQFGAQTWQAVFSNKNPITVAREADYNCLAGQGRVIDLETRSDQAKMLSQIVLPTLVQMGQMTGNMGPVNLVLEEVAKSNQIDPELMKFPNMPPPMPDEERGGVASPPNPRGEGKGPKN